MALDSIHLPKPFQAEYPGSIPGTRSNTLPKKPRQDKGLHDLRGRIKSPSCDEKALLGGAWGAFLVIRIFG